MQLEQKLVDRIKAMLGDTITEADLKPLIERAVKEAFFDDIVIKDHYGHVTSRKPPHFLQLMQTEMNALVKTQVDKWFTENPTVAAEAIEAVIKKGIMKMISDELEQQMSAPFYQLTQKLRERGINL